jgi:DNA-binding response OmpR family regulator
MLILIVDDHPDTNLALQLLLRRMGHEVLSAVNVEEAIAVALKEPIDLMITDIGLPDGTGWSLLERLSPQKKVKAIAVSGFGTEAD